MFARRLAIWIQNEQSETRPVPLAWLDSFTMRNFYERPRFRRHIAGGPAVFSKPAFASPCPRLRQRWRSGSGLKRGSGPESVCVSSNLLTAMCAPCLDPETCVAECPRVSQKET